MSRDGKPDTRGVALISVMLVVSIVSSMAAQLLYRQHIDIERSTRIMSREQAFLYVLGLETYARDLLARDDTQSDYCYPHGRYEEGDAKLEEWSWPIPHGEMPDEWLDVFRRIDVQVEARVYDLSGFFNVNAVRRVIHSRIPADSPDEFIPSPWEKRYKMYEKTFKGLLGGISRTRVDESWNTLVDWFDRDDRVSAGGAEDDEYLDLEPSYITGQVRMAWPDEIRLLKGFDGAVADRLLPMFASLPAGPHRMNINTVDSRLLRHIPGLDQFVVGEIQQRLSNEDYFRDRADIRSFFNSLASQPASGEEGEELRSAADFFKAKSRFFLFSARVRFGSGRPVEIQSVLERSREQDENEENEVKKVVVLQRRIGSGYYKEGRCGRVASHAPSPVAEA